MVASVVLEQVSFRARGDTVGLNVDTWDHALNANFTQAVDTTFRIRFTIAETNGGMANNIAYSLQFNLNGAGYIAIGDTAAVKSALSSQFTNADPTTQIISTGTFVAGAGYEQTTTSNITLSSSRTEIEWSLSIDSAQVANNDTILLRVVQAAGVVLQTYTQTPTITVVEAAPPVTLTSSLDAAISRQLSLAATSEAAISAGGQVTTGADAAISVSSSAVTSAEALVQAALQAISSAEAAVAAALAASASLEANISAAAAATATAATEAAVTATITAVSATEAAISATISAVTALEAIILGVPIVTALAEGVVSGAGAATLAAEAYIALSSAGSATVEFNALASIVDLVTTGLDAINTAVPLGTCGMQAFVGGVVVNDLYSVTAGGHALRSVRAIGSGRTAVGLSGE